ncbi:MAG: L,D-transpeptidase family protein [Blautia sp.]|nr:L,D-transpeptidase family protein [Blautia sp.]
MKFRKFLTVFALLGALALSQAAYAEEAAETEAVEAEAAEDEAAEAETAEDEATETENAEAAETEDDTAVDSVLLEQTEDILHASIQHEIDSPEWVTALPQAQDENVNQLFVVAGMSMDTTTATISMHQRDEEGNWKQILSTPGFVGKNGLCLDEEHKEGCGQTPVGVYSFNKAFGIAPDPGCAIPYTQVDNNTYWSGDDKEGMHYNEMVDLKDYPDLDMENSEHIVDYEYQYQYCLNISFNEDGTPGRGSAIFLHCFGPTKPYTGGCVALPENIMKQVMQNVQPDCVVVIDTLENLNGSL